MKKLMSPFKSPELNYIPSYSTKTLGLRAPRAKRAMYDPDAINALILYTPPEMDAQEKLLKAE